MVAVTTKPERMQLTADDPRHGTSVAYCYYKCRCDVCRNKHREYVRNYRATSAGRAKTRQHNDDARRRMVLAAAWVKTNRPDIWNEICQAVESKQRT